MNTAWKKVKIKDIGSVITGNTPPRKNPEFYGNHTLFIKPTDIQEDVRYTKNPEECYSEIGFKKYKNSLIPKGSTCVVTIGSIGKKMTQVHCDCFVNQAVNAVVPSKDYDENFVYYLLKYNLNQVKGLDSGTASGRENVSKTAFSNIEVSVPNALETQTQIANILSAYDDLIENNLRRIKLLEEMAELTYREWFVNFKIDGKTLEIDKNTGLPFGWERKSLTHLGEFLNGFAFKPEDWEDSGFPIIKIKELKAGINNETPRNNGSKIPSKYIVKSGDILFSWSASLEVVVWQGETGLLNQHLFKVTPFSEIPKSLLFLALKDSLNIFNNLSTGATMKHIKRKELDFVEIPIPQQEILNQFDNVISPIIKQTLNLSHQNRLLKESRDILLPRLMSGEVLV